MGSSVWNTRPQLSTPTCSAACLRWRDAILGEIYSAKTELSFATMKAPSIYGFTLSPTRVSAADSGSLKATAAALFLPTISARALNSWRMLVRKDTISFARNARETSSVTAALVSMMIIIRLFLMDVVRKSFFIFHLGIGHAALKQRRFPAPVRAVRNARQPLPGKTGRPAGCSPVHSLRLPERDSRY